MSSWVLFLIGIFFFLIGLFLWVTAVWLRFSHGNTTWTSTAIWLLVVGIILFIIGIILLIWGYIAYSREFDVLLASIPPRRDLTPQQLAAQARLRMVLEGK